VIGGRRGVWWGGLPVDCAGLACPGGSDGGLCCRQPTLTGVSTPTNLLNSAVHHYYCTARHASLAPPHNTTPKPSFTSLAHRDSRFSPTTIILQLLLRPPPCPARLCSPPSARCCSAGRGPACPPPVEARTEASLLCPPPSGIFVIFSDPFLLSARPRCMPRDIVLSSTSTSSYLLPLLPTTRFCY
jgi:hypothetical protein